MFPLFFFFWFLRRSRGQSRCSASCILHVTSSSSSMYCLYLCSIISLCHLSCSRVCWISWATSLCSPGFSRPITNLERNPSVKLTTWKKKKKITQSWIWRMQTRANWKPLNAPCINQWEIHTLKTANLKIHIQNKKNYAINMHSSKSV